MVEGGGAGVCEGALGGGGEGRELGLSGVRGELLGGRVLGGCAAAAAGAGAGEVLLLELGGEGGGAVAR